MLSGFRTAALTFCAVAFISGCAGRGQSVPTMSDARSEASVQRQPSSAITGLFEQARGKVLKDGDYDSYIDPSVVGADRVLARKLMAYMPANLRGDFAYFDPNGRIVTNNPALRPFLKLDQSYQSPIKSSGRKQSSAAAQALSSVRTAQDYSSQCSPPNPPSSPGGPYVRVVSPCGFAGAWGFVTIDEGTSQMATTADQGYAYFELKGSNGTLVEAGLDYLNDGNIEPYMRGPNTGNNGNYVSLTNGGDRFIAGEPLGIFFGVTGDQAYLYANIGSLPPNLDPASTYLTGVEVTLAPSAWTFYPNLQGIATGPGTDPAGAPSPCMQCSVSQVVTIGQAGVSSWTDDGSYFGANVYTGEQNSIEWNQVVFGNWESSCGPSASVCYIKASTDPLVYLGGTQAYPDGYVSQVNLGPSDYGAYESFDGINTLTDDFNNANYHKMRAPAGAFNEPLPPVSTPTAVPTARPIKSPPPCTAAMTSTAGGKSANVICPQTQTN